MNTEERTGERAGWPLTRLAADVEEGAESLTVAAPEIHQALSLLRADPGMRFDCLTDLTAVDYLHIEPCRRFEVIYHLNSSHFNRRLRVQVPVEEQSPALPTASDIWPAADWFEREVYDMFGISFNNHPDLRRILLPSDFIHHPLRKDYPLQGLGERERIPAESENVSPDPASADLESWFEAQETGDDEEREDEAQTAILDGLYPLWRGELRVAFKTEGEKVLRAAPDPGYLHSGFEKLGEQLTYIQQVPVADRVNQRAPVCSSLALALTVEALMGLEVPKKGQYIRVVLGELGRIAAHLIWLEEQALTVGAQIASACAAEQRERLCEIFAAATGSRTMTGCIRIGGVPEDLPPRFAEMVEEFLGGLRHALDEIHSLLTYNRIWIERTRGVGVIPTAEAIAWGLSGPVLRASGVERDVRKDEPYAAYEEFDFEVVVGEAGDVYDRYLVRLEEMVQSSRIVEQALRQMPDGPCCIEDGKLFLPPKEDVEKHMEPLIHHFKLWMDGHGLQPPAGAQVYLPTESPNGELGFFIVSDGTDRPYRLRLRTPSFAHYQIFPRLIEGATLADIGVVLGSLNVVAGEVDR